MDGWMEKCGFFYLFVGNSRERGIEWNGYMIGMVDERGLR